MSNSEFLQSLELLKQEVNNIDKFITEIPTRENLIASNEKFHNRVGNLLENLKKNLEEKLYNHKSRSDLIEKIMSLYDYFDIIFSSIHYILINIHTPPSNSYKVTLEENLKRIIEKIHKIERAITLYDNPSDKKTEQQVLDELAGAEREAGDMKYYAERHKQIAEAKEDRERYANEMLSGKRENSGGGRRIKKRTRRHKKKRGKKTRGKRTRKL